MQTGVFADTPGGSLRGMGSVVEDLWLFGLTRDLLTYLLTQASLLGEAE